MAKGPIMYQSWITRGDLQANNGIAYYLFGDNTKRKGLGGQAKEMRGEPNAIGIATKLLPSQYANSFFTDDDYTDNTRIIANDMREAFLRRDQGYIIVIPADGLGTGLSELPTRAPRTNNFLVSLLETLESGRTPVWKSILNGDGRGTYGKG